MKLHRLVFHNGFTASRDKLCEADVPQDLYKVTLEVSEAEYDAVYERLDAEADA